MIVMKKTISVLLSVLLLFALTACGSTGAAEDKTSVDTESAQPAAEEKSENLSDQTEQTESGVTDVSEPAQETASAAETDTAVPSSDVLVVYFSATGTTKGVAEKIAAITGGDLYEIKAAQEYTEADLDWNDSSSRTTKEQNDSSIRPEIGSESVSLDGYSTIYIGYPIWWGKEPKVIRTFLESYNLKGKTIIPFCTSGSSGISGSMKGIRESAAGARVKKGKDLTDMSYEQVKKWVSRMM